MSTSAAPALRCIRCGTLLRKNRPACPSCGAENSGRPAVISAPGVPPSAAAQEAAHVAPPKPAPSAPPPPKAAGSVKRTTPAPTAPAAGTAVAAPAKPAVAPAKPPIGGVAAPKIQLPKIPAPSQAPPPPGTSSSANKVTPAASGGTPAKPTAKATVKICPVCLQTVSEKDMVEREGKKVCAECHQVMVRKASKA